jgi:sugar lactone lactonase YvrE
MLCVRAVLLVSAIALGLVSGPVKAYAQTRFGSVNVGGHLTGSVTVAFLNSGMLGSTSVLTRGSLRADFANAGGGTCTAGVTYPVNATCIVNVLFTPGVAGTEQGAVVLNDESGNVLATAYISGIGVGPQPVFLPGAQTAIGNGWLQPSGVAVDGAGNVFVANSPLSPGGGGGSVVKETLSGGVYTQSTIGSGFSSPTGIAVDGAGNVYVVDSAQQGVFKETPSPQGYLQTKIPTAGLGQPVGIAVDGAGNLFITDAANNNIVEEAPSQGSYIQSVIGTGLNTPTGIAVDGNGNLYVGDWGNQRIVMETLSAGVYSQSTLLNNIPESGAVGGSLAVDGAGNLYVAETSLNQIVMYPWSGQGFGAPVTLSSQSQPVGLAVSGNGNIYTSLQFNGVIGLDLSDPPSLSFASAIEGSTSADSPQTVTMENIGNATLKFPVPSSGVNPSLSQNFTLTFGSASDCPRVAAGASSFGVLTEGSSCLLPISFTPTVVGTINGFLSIIDNSLNAASPGAYATQKISLSGTGTPKIPVIQWSNPAPITYGAPLTATQLNASSPVPGTFSYSPPQGTILPAGQQVLSVFFTPNDTVNYTTTSASVVLVINQAVPSISWSSPAPIVYGTPLSSAQLNAGSPISGNFSYTPGPGAVLSAGLQTLSVTFFPSDSNDYTTATATVSLTVTKATPSLSWGVPAPITYGTTLGPNQLNASSSVGGTFAYAPPAGSLLPAGTQTLSVIFTPTDAVDYTNASTTVQLVVNKATPSISWAQPAPITYGAALSGKQLDATSTLPGTFSYTPSAGTVLSAGLQQLTATFTPADSNNYTPAGASVFLTVNQAVPTIQWASPAAITYGTPLSGTQLNATSPIAGTFAYSYGAGTVLPAGAQTLSVTFTPTDSVDYSTASASVPLTVRKAVPGITWNSPAPIIYGTLLNSSQLDATASVPGTFVYSPPLGSLLHVGFRTLSVTFTPSDTTDYTTATASVGITVNVATPTINWPTPSPITYGTKLTGNQLNATSNVPGVFTYAPPSGTILPAGSQTLSVTFTPSDSTDYTASTASVVLSVKPAVPTISCQKPASIVYGTPWSAAALNCTASVPGAFAYSPSSGTILPAGLQTLSITFNPTDTVDYASVSTTETLLVTKAQSTVTWSTPAAIYYGTALSSTQLDAQSTLPGAFTYSVQPGTVLSAGARTLSVTFTPSDSNDYSSSTASVVIAVLKAPLTVTALDRTKVYGQALPSLPYTYTGFVNGDTQAHPGRLVSNHHPSGKPGRHQLHLYFGAGNADCYPGDSHLYRQQREQGVRCLRACADVLFLRPGEWRYSGGGILRRSQSLVHGNFHFSRRSLSHHDKPGQPCLLKLRLCLRKWKPHDHQGTAHSYCQQ